MKLGPKIFLCLFAAICLVQCVSAENYDVDSIEITPSSGSLSPGDRVTVNALVTLTGTGDVTFSSEHSLEAYTDLDDLTWTYSIKVNGQGMDKTNGKRYLTLTGWELSYPDETEVEVNYYLEGVAPEVSTSTEKVLFRLRQFDSDDELVKDGEYSVKRTVVDPEDVQTTLDLRETELADLRQNLDDRIAEGVSVTEAEAKYDAAENALNSARTAGAGQAQGFLDQAGTLIDEGEDLLDEAWAQARIDDAQAKIDQVEDLLTYFKDERNMGSDARVVSIETQLDNAQTLLTLAKDKMASDNFGQARVQAENADTKAATALNSSLALQEEIGEGGLPIPSIGGGLMTYLIGGVVVIIVAAIGVVIYRRRTRWDELG
jgi:hypothetical protein